MTGSSILTTHVGSLPRPPELLDLLVSQDRGEVVDVEAMQRLTTAAVDEVVARQIATGIDIVSDGEFSKISYTNYVKFRFGGIGEGTPLSRTPGDLRDYPEYVAAAADSMSKTDSGVRPLAPTIAGPLSYDNRDPLEADLAAFRSAVDAHQPTGAFLNGASPGVLPMFVLDEFYGDEEAYLADLVEVMRVEYEAIVEAGFQLQIDCPDLAMGRHGMYADLSEQEFLRIAERNVEALNAATANIDPASMRMHVCWGNYPGPHTRDIELNKIASVILSARPQTLLLEGANPRHSHEFDDLRDIDIPDGKVLCPGVIDSMNNVVEHPRVVAQRIVNWANVVGRDQVMAGSDCGFSTVATLPRVYPSVVWKKFESLAEGAALATDQLFG